MKYLSLPSSGRQSTSVRVSCSARQQARVTRQPLTCVGQRTSFYAVASCGLLPRTTRPGPRLRTAFWSVASPHPREEGVARALTVGATFVQRGADQLQDSRVSRSGRIATVTKAVQRRGPGRVVLGSKPQLATAKELVSWARRD